MSLSLATILTGFFLLLLGIALCKNPAAFSKGLRTFPRSKKATLILLVAATAWVLWNVSQLGEADFGNYKKWLGGFFLLLAIGSWFGVPDFLGIRAMAVLLLLLSGAVLQSAFFQDPTTRLFLVGFSYFVIVISLYLAAVPYRFRDWVERVQSRDGLRKSLGFFTIGYALLLLILPVTY